MSHPSVSKSEQERRRVNPFSSKEKIQDDAIMLVFLSFRKDVILFCLLLNLPRAETGRKGKEGI